ncbi:Uncharacterized protein ToN1_30170 [Aromatoleum petrolei]|nr:Uncharacterized protein ToN1_30170 [Aromatoleum petrolei]
MQSRGICRASGPRLHADDAGFAYLIPAAMLIGLGKVLGVLATVIFAMLPVVRLTSRGIR